MFYLRDKLKFYGLDEKSFFYFTFKIISGACQDIGIGGVGAVSWVVSEVLSNYCYVCSRCLSMLGHSSINIASGFSNIHLSTRACDFVYHICSHVQRYFVFYVEELPNSTTFIQNYNFKFCLGSYLLMKPNMVFLTLDVVSSKYGRFRNTTFGFTFEIVSCWELLLSLISGIICALRKLLINL